MQLILHMQSTCSLITASAECVGKRFFHEFESKHVRWHARPLPSELAQYLRVALLEGLVDAVVKIVLLVCAHRVL